MAGESVGGVTADAALPGGAGDEPTTPSLVDVDEVLDRIRLRGLPLLVVFCASVILVLDGFDIQVIGIAAPAIVADWGIDRGALAPALAASLLGMAVGAAGIGPIGDRWGRRPAVLICTVVFGAGTLLAATANGVASLVLWRFVTGAGLGGALPGVTALMAEFSPPKWRSQAIGAAVVGVPVGGMLGAALAAEIVPAFGWRAIFVVGGVLPLLAAGAMWLVLPESPRFLTTRRTEWPRLAKLLNRIENRERYSPEDGFVLGQAALATRTRGLRAVFVPELRRDAALTAFVFLTSFFAVYAFFNWAPLVLTSMSFELADAVRATLVFNLAGVAGALANGWIMARLGSRVPLAANALAGLLALAWLAWASPGAGSSDYPALLAGIAVAGFGINAVIVGMYAVAAHVFPTECRTSGIGLALSAGRLGGILSSFAGGLLLSLGGGAGFFAGTGGAFLLTLATLLLVRRHIARGAQQPNAAAHEATT
jgi:AAHS family 4-hydroxybenzoate transporter-like MFS transporter